MHQTWCCHRKSLFLICICKLASLAWSVAVVRGIMGLMQEDSHPKRPEPEKPDLDYLLAWANGAGTKTTPSPPWARPCTIYGSSSPIGWQTGALQQSHRVQHKAFCDRPDELAFSNPTIFTQSSAVIYSLSETSKGNDLDQHRYLVWLQNNAARPSWTDET